MFADEPEMICNKKNKKTQAFLKKKQNKKHKSDSFTHATKCDFVWI